MQSLCERYVITFNGEIYNHKYLRQQLDKTSTGLQWRGTSDTETLLQIISIFGLDRALSEIDGMFAFALWDKKEQKIHLCRDRVGEKPLYYGLVKNVFYFASEVHAIESATTGLETCGSAIAYLLKYGYIPHPHSVYRNIYKLSPGHVVTLEPKSLAIQQTHRYWSPSINNCQPYHLSAQAPASMVEGLDSVLERSVRDRMVSDVEIGALLSGGIDSTYITALMQKQSKMPVKTFTIGFHESGFNEADQAKSVAAFLGTDHTEMYLSESDLLSTIPEIASHYDEPFADSSQLPTYLVSRLAASEVKVVLTGDGADELFYGYKRYEIAKRLWSLSRMLPQSARLGLSGQLEMVSNALSNTDSKMLQFVTKKLLKGNPTKLGALADLLKTKSFLHFYDSIISNHKSPERYMKEVCKGVALFSETQPSLAGVAGDDIANCMMVLDFLTYLPGDILCKVDRASMANSLETRAPMLGREVVDFALGLPMDLKVRGKDQKWLLKQGLAKHVPRHLTDRPKKGFSVPLDVWLRGPLKEWASDLLASEALQSDTHLDAKRARSLLDDHLIAKASHGTKLWPLLMYASWRAER